MLQLIMEHGVLLHPLLQNWTCRVLWIGLVVQGMWTVQPFRFQPSQPCYQPDTLVSHASFAFNSYYQQNGATDITCSFGGTGVKPNKNPSYDYCLYMTTRGNVKTANNVTAMHAASSTITCDISVLIAGYVLLALLSFF